MQNNFQIFQTIILLKLAAMSTIQTLLKGFYQIIFVKDPRVLVSFYRLSNAAKCQQEK